MIGIVTVLLASFMAVLVHPRGDLPGRVRRATTASSPRCRSSRAVVRLVRLRHRLLTGPETATPFATLRAPMPGPFIKHYMMTAGPTPLPPAVSNAMAEPILYHRAPAFVELYAHCLDGLKRVFQTENDVLTFAASGSGGMESAVANLAPAGQGARRLVRQVRRALGRAERGVRRRLRPPRLRLGQPRRARRARARPRREPRDVKVVYTTLSETSTGVVNDIEALTEVAHDAGALIVVDAVSGLGAVPIPQDEWGVDVVAAGSQKALMCPPGLGFASPNQKALDLAAGGRRTTPTTSTGRRRSRASARIRRTARSRRPCRSSWRLDVALQHDRGRGPRERLRAPPPARRRRARRGQGARASSSSAPRTSAPTSSPRSRSPRASTAASCPRSCATSTTSPRTAARTSSRARSCGSPTPATSAPSTSSLSVAGDRDGAARPGRRRRGRRRRRRRAARRSRRPACPPALPRERHARASSSRRRSPTRGSSSCDRSSTSTWASTGRTASWPSGSATTTRSSSARRPS